MFVVNTAWWRVKLYSLTPCGQHLSKLLPKQNVYTCYESLSSRFTWLMTVWQLR